MYRSEEPFEESWQRAVWECHICVGVGRACMGVYSVPQCGVHVPSDGSCWSVKSVQECRSSQCVGGQPAQQCVGVQSAGEYSLHGSTV